MVLDVEHFALLNAHGACYPEHIDKTIAIVDLGSRYANVLITRRGFPLLMADIPVGGNAVTEFIKEFSGLTKEQAENLKRLEDDNEHLVAEVKVARDTSVEQVASELQRQLGFLWGTSSGGEGLDKILLTGGGALLSGLAKEVGEKCGVECEIFDPLKGIRVDEEVNERYLQANRSFLTVALGLALRRTGDKE